MSLLNELNLKQREAVGTSDGPVLIVAGPGTGKTKTLISRITFLIENENAQPENILALTFTKKAAGEMLERLQNALPDRKRQPFIGTFHALCFDILSKNQNTPRPIISDEKRKELIKQLIRNLPADSPYENFKVKDLSLVISLHKNQLSANQTALSSIISSYDQLLFENGLLDYDDLIGDTYKMLKSNQGVSEKVQKQFQYVLVDEFQDTSPLQYELLKLLVGSEQNIFVIGDPLQAIYSFRGSSDQIFFDFKQDFPNAKEINLIENYRSHQDIVDVAHKLFPNTPQLQCQANTMAAEVMHVTTLNEYTEADWIFKKIAALMGGLNLADASSEHDALARFSDFAITYRTHNLARILKQKLKDSAIPCQSVGQESIYEQKQTKFVISCLKYLLNKATPLADLTAAEKITLDTIDANQKLSNIAKQIAETFKVAERLQSKNHKLLEFYEFLNSLVAYNNDPNGLKHFIADIDNLKENEYYDAKADKVTLLTMHAAKGLEFKYVFILGFEDGLIPFIKENQGTNFEEEKRLLYVAITRAKHGLYFISAKERNKQKKRQVSRYKQELAASTLKEVVDEAILRIERKRQKKKRKQEQQTLF